MNWWIVCEMWERKLGLMASWQCSFLKVPYFYFCRDSQKLLFSRRTYLCPFIASTMIVNDAKDHPILLRFLILNVSLVIRSISSSPLSFTTTKALLWELCKIDSRSRHFSERRVIHIGRLLSLSYSPSLRWRLTGSVQNTDALHRYTME